MRKKRKSDNSKGSGWAPLWSVLSAVLLLLAFPPFNAWPLLFVAMVPWLASLANQVAQAKSPGRAGFRAGIQFGLIYTAGQIFWLLQFIERWTGNLALSLVPWVIITIIISLYFGLAGWMMVRCWQHRRPWAIPLVWAGVEVFRSFIPVIAFPWGLLATPLWRVPALAQSASLGGIFLVSAWIVGVNVLLASLLVAPKVAPPVRSLVPLMVATFVVPVISIGLFLQPIAGKSKRFVLIQPGVDMAFSDQSTEQTRLRRSITPRLIAAQALVPDLIVLPEAMAEVQKMPPDPPFTVPKSTPILFGGVRGAGPRYQSSFAYDGNKWQFADKTRLVIFGEYVPLRQYLPDSFNLPSGDLIPSRDGIKTYLLGDYTVGPMLCFEGLFPDTGAELVRRGANVLAVMSIDDWFMGTTAIDQLRAGSIWRAIENRTPLVRVGSLGTTMASDARGRVVGELPLQVADALVVSLQVPEKPAGFPWITVFSWLAVSSWLFAIIPGRKKP